MNGEDEQRSHNRPRDHLLILIIHPSVIEDECEVKALIELQPQWYGKLVIHVIRTIYVN